MDGVKGFFLKAARLLFLAVMGLMLLDVFFLCHVNYTCKNTFLLPNIVLLLVGALLLLAIFFLLYHGRIKSFAYDRVAVLLVVFLFLAQLYIFYNILFLTGWDSFQVIYAALFLADGTPENINLMYFSTYPNNMVLVELYAALFKFAASVLRLEGREFFWLIVVINAFLNSMSCFLVYHSVKNIGSRQVAFAALCFSVLLFGFSPWTVICYSDSAALFCPILVFYLYSKPARTKAGRRCLLVLAGAVSLVGYFIKPQAVFVLIAILLVEFFFHLSVKGMLRYAASGVLVLLAAFGMGKGLERYHESREFVVNRELSVGMAHYFMMGLNQINDGVYLEEDVVYSTSIPTSKLRTKRNLAEAKRRLKEFGFLGYLGHLQKKLLVVYNDGTFAWGKEGTFYFLSYPEPNENAAPFLRDVFYDTGGRYPYLATFLQGIWLLVLVLDVAAAVLCGKQAKEETVLYLTILGITAFELLFEARARYLYIFTPIYCAVAALGAYRLYLRFKDGLRAGKAAG